MLSDKPWKPESVLRLFQGIFVSIAAGSLLTYFLQKAGYLGAKDQPNMTRMLLHAFSLQGMALVFIHFFLADHGIGWGEGFGFRDARLGRSLLLGLLAAVLAVRLAWALNEVSARLLTMVHIEAEAQQSIQTLQAAKSVPEKIYFAVVAIVLAPLVEELIFRGILYPALKRAGRRQIALWATSLFFAAIHANLVTFIPLTFLAVVFTLLYEMTGNLAAPILAHGLFNATNYYLVVSQSQPTGP